MFDDFRFRMRALFQREAMDAELDEEIQFHFEHQVEKLMAAGMGRKEAVRQTRLLFGGQPQIKEDCRESRGLKLLETTVQDVRYGIRVLLKTPGVTLIAILTLALGIGANTAIFTVLDALMFKQLPVAAPERLVQLRRANGDDSFTYALWRQVRAQQDVLSGVFAYQGFRYDTAGVGEKRFVSGLYVSGGYFSTLGVPAILGRTISEQDDRRGATPVAVISYAYWQRQLGGDPDVLKRQITLEKHPVQIVGVAARGFNGIDVGSQFDVAVPLEAERVIDAPHPILDRPMGWWLYAFGSIKPGVSLEKAQARMKALSPFIADAALPPQADADTRDWYSSNIELAPAGTGISALRDSYGRALIVLSAMLGIVLSIACTNVANLQFARASARRREFAIRAALGAGRTRIVRQLLMESLLLAAAGATAGMLLARIASGLLVAATSSRLQPSVLDLSPDFRLVLFVLGVTVLAASIFGLAPALQLAHAGPQDAMKQDSQAALGRRRWEWSRLLLPAQVALSIVLLFGATLFVRSLRDLVSQNLGFRKDGVLLMDTDLRKLPGTDAQRQQVASSLGERLASIPGVDSVSRSDVTPISGSSWQWDVTPETGADAAKIHVYGNLIAPNFFRTLGTPLIAGRDFNAQDTEASPLVAIVNQAAAQRMFPGLDPIGQTYHQVTPKQQPSIRIVGLVGDAKYRHLRDAAPPTIYIPIPQNTASRFPVIGTFELHFAGPAASIERQAEAAAAALVPQISIEFQLLSTQVNDSVRQQRLIAVLASAFGILAQLLACIGIYGAMAYSVSRRTQEIGVRMALGARPFDVIRMVMRESLLLVGVGVAIGVPVAIGASLLVRNMLFGVRPVDPLTLGLTLTIMMSTAALAAYKPAARASRTNPAIALRSE